MGRMTVTLWALFALALAFGGWQFLFACGLTLGAHAWNYCPAPLDPHASIAEAERGERLLRGIHAAEMTLAEKALCPAPPPKPVGETDRTIERTYRDGAKPGTLEVFLAWKTLDDLDLVIHCPGDGSLGGAVDHAGSCGDGAIDKDANRNLGVNVSSTPVEHAVWQQSIPEGAYRLAAYVYRVTDPARSRTIPFTMIFKIGDQERTCEGKVAYFASSSGKKRRDGKPMIAQDLYVDWNAGGVLPTCEWREYEDSWCGEVACQGR
jgi:hypothetical protein